VAATASPAFPCLGDDSHGELHLLIWRHGVLLRSLSAFANPGKHDLEHEGSDEATWEGAALGGPSFVDPMMMVCLLRFPFQVMPSTTVCAAV